MSKKIIYLLIPILLLIFAFACDDFEQKDFYTEGIDQKACTTLNDTLLVPLDITAKNITDYDTSWHGEAIYSNVSAIVNALIDDTLIVESGDDLFLVKLPAADTSYIALTTDLSNVVVYITNSVEINPVKSDGSVVSPSDLTIKMELVYECPDLKYRAQFSDLNPSALLQIVKGEQFSGSNMKMLILGN